MAVALFSARHSVSISILLLLWLQKPDTGTANDAHAMKILELLIDSGGHCGDVTSEPAEQKACKEDIVVTSPLSLQNRQACKENIVVTSPLSMQDKQACQEDIVVTSPLSLQDKQACKEDIVVTSLRESAVKVTCKEDTVVTSTLRL